MSKKLYIARWSAQWRFNYAFPAKAQRFAFCANVFDDALVNGGVAHDTAPFHVLAPRFKLGFDQGDDEAARSEYAFDRGEQEREGDEGSIGHGDGGNVREQRGVERARVDSVHGDDARVCAESRVQLVVADIHGIDTRCAVLQEAVGEAARRSADIEADRIFDAQVPVGECGFQFFATSTHEALGRFDGDFGIGRYGVTGF